MTFGHFRYDRSNRSPAARARHGNYMGAEPVPGIWIAETAKYRRRVPATIPLPRGDQVLIETGMPPLGAQIVAEGACKTTRKGRRLLPLVHGHVRDGRKNEL